MSTGRYTIKVDDLSVIGALGRALVNRGFTEASVNALLANVDEDEVWGEHLTRVLDALEDTGEGVLVEDDD